MADTLLILIVLFIVFEFIVSKIIGYLNYQNLKKEVPKELKEIYDDKTVQQTRNYEKIHLRFGWIVSTLSLLAILAMLIFKGFAYLDDFVRRFTDAPLPMALLYFGILFIISDLLNMPFSIYSTFVIEEKFGFNKTTPSIFIIDKLKSYLLGIIIGGGLLSLIILIYLWTGKWFWLIGWITVTVVSMVFTMFYTSILLPIFNKLTPMEDGELKSAIQAYAKTVDFPLKHIYIMDGSKRSTKANAFFSGMGKKKSIVLFDTLIEKHTTEELVAILAHEVGHYKKKHIQKGFIISTIQTGILFYIFGLIVSSPVLPHILGSEHSSFHLALIAFGLLYSPISMVLGLFMNIFSRKNEYEADAFAKKTYGEKPLISALKKLSSSHLSHFNPHPAYVFVNYSHPPLISRIKALKKS